MALPTKRVEERQVNTAVVEKFVAPTEDEGLLLDDHCDVSHTLYNKDDEMEEVEPLELHDEDIEKVEEGVDVEIDKAAISQSVTPVNPFMLDMLQLKLSKINYKSLK